jgi:hypothetical protein
MAEMCHIHDRFIQHGLPLLQAASRPLGKAHHQGLILLNLFEVEYI